MRLSLRCLVITFALTLACVAQTSAAHFPSRWNAKWITCPDIPARDAGVCHLRTTIRLSKKLQQAVVYVSGDNHFILHVNGVRIGDGPALGGPAHWRFETYDLGPFLHPGDNVVAATVWNYGERGPISQMSVQTGFLMQTAPGSDLAADTGPDWEAKREPAIEFLPPDWDTLHQYYAAPPGERLDGRRFDWEWDGGSKVGWVPAEVLSGAALRGAQDAPNAWGLVPDVLPTMEFIRQSGGKIVRQSGIANTRFPDAPVVIPAGTDTTILIDNGVLTTAYPELVVSGGAGSEIRLTYSEALYDANGHKGNRNEVEGRHIVGVFDDFISDGGAERQFVPVTWRTWRYLQIEVKTGSAALTLDKFTSWFTAYPFVEHARFSADDDELTRVWQVGWRTARLCAHDTYMDTPYWERLQYSGDTRIQMLISYTVAGDDRLARQAMEALDASRIPDGITASRYPSALPQYIPPFSLLWIGMLHDFWMYRPDAAYLQQFLRGERDVLDWFIHYQRPDGLLGLLPWWNFVDWTEGFPSGVPPQDADGGSTVLTLQFVAALRDAADLEAAFGDPTLAARYRSVAEKAALGVRARCWSSEAHLLADTPAKTHYSQQANALGVLLDVIPREQQTKVMNTILAASDATFHAEGHVPPISTASYYFRFYLARALDHSGMAGRYIDMLNPWRQMLAEGLTTWAETPVGTRSDSHAWSAHPNYDLLTLVAGIKPGSPGFTTVDIEPHLGKLTQLRATMPHPKGAIAVSYTALPSGINADITLPAGITGTFRWHGQSVPLHSGSQSVKLRSDTSK